MRQQKNREKKPKTKNDKINKYHIDGIRKQVNMYLYSHITACAVVDNAALVVVIAAVVVDFECVCMIESQFSSLIKTRAQ